ncbi:MAG: RNA polymerase sigma factor, partial [Planctomycetota bacterium]
SENCQRLLDCLTPDLQTLALSKLEGYTNREIADQLDCSTPTIERRLKLIRKKWERVLLS